MRPIRILPYSYYMLLVDGGSGCEMVPLMTNLNKSRGRAKRGFEQRSSAWYPSAIMETVPAIDTSECDRRVPLVQGGASDAVLEDIQPQSEILLLIRDRYADEPLRMQFMIALQPVSRIGFDQAGAGFPSGRQCEEHPTQNALILGSGHDDRVEAEPPAIAMQREDQHQHEEKEIGPGPLVFGTVEAKP